MNKSYTKKEASKLVDESLAINSFGDDIITLSDKGRIVDAVYKRMNNVDYNERGNMASRYADYLVNNAFSTNINTLESLQSQRDVLSYFRDNIRHKIDLTSIADEIKYKFDKSASGTTSSPLGDDVNYYQCPKYDSAEKFACLEFWRTKTLRSIHTQK